jgi:Domain of unknown function (DUF4375)
MTDSNSAIAAALAKAGHSDLFTWAEAAPTVSVRDLATRLGLGIAPVELEQLIGDSARGAGCYDRFLRMQVGRRVAEYFPDGFAVSVRKEYGLSAAWAMCAGLFDPTHRGVARAMWMRLEDMLAQHGAWVPTGPDDPLLIDAFAGQSWELTPATTALRRVNRRIEEIATLRNDCYDYAQAARNFATVAPGYGYVWGVYVVDGEVCNGGFAQLYANTGGTPVPFAVDGLKLMGRHQLAEVVRKSQEASERPWSEVLSRLRPSGNRARGFDELDQEYYRLRSTESEEWLELALGEFVLHSELF